METKKRKYLSGTENMPISEMVFSRKVRFGKLAKSTLIFTTAPALIIVLFVINGYVNFYPGLFLFSAIFALALLFTYPYLADLQEVTKYVESLAENKSPIQPTISFLNNVEELSDSINKLNDSWKEKSQRLEYLLAAEINTHKMLNDFVANASHEMKTPLSGIIGYLETLTEVENDPETQKKFLGIIKEQSLRLNRLINDLLALSVIEAGVNKNKFEVLKLADILNEALGNLQNLSESRKVKIVSEVEENISTFRGNKDEISRVFDNLISNAVKYSSEGKEVLVKVFEVKNSELKFANYPGWQNFLAINVKDFGEGIPAKAIPRLTERFYRVNKARSRNIGGSGLGLAIVSHILKNHNGLLDIKSEVGVGSEFTAYLPLA